MRETKIDKLGRIVIPKDYRKKLRVEADDTVSISLSGDEIIIKNVSVRCLICNEKTENEPKICDKCKAKIILGI